MLTYAPVPRFGRLARSIVRGSAVSDSIVAPWCRAGDVGGLLSRSAWSLAAIVQWRAQRAENRSVRVWVPDYFCNAALDPIRSLGVTPYFYPLDAQLAPATGQLRELAEAGAPDIVVLVHYFGRPAAALATRDLCARTGAWLVEDAAHVVRPVDGVGEHGDFVVYSPHKHLPIPDGAVLVVRKSGPARFDEAAIAHFGKPSTWADQLTSVAGQLGKTNGDSDREALLWLAKRCLQRLGVRRMPRVPVPFSDTGWATGSVRVPTAPAASALARRLLATEATRLDRAAGDRRRNQARWDDIVCRAATPADALAAPAERAADGEWAPYLAAFSVNALVAQRVYAEWHQGGRPVTTWPDLPPEVLAAPDRHHRAHELRATRLFLPVHESVGGAALRRLAPAKDADGAHYSVRWDESTDAQWEAWLAAAGRSNLLQSWSYGNAKAATSRWSVRRCVIERNGEPAAIAQTLQRAVLGARLVRINRGVVPIGQLHPTRQAGVWRALRRAVAGPRSLLSIAPELDSSGAALNLLDALGFRRRDVLPWRSAWVDLQIDEATLRKRLNGKWRNMLNAAEREGLALDAGSDAQRLEWMLSRYRQLMTERHFSGPPIELVRALHLDAPSRLLVFRAMHNGEPVAGIAVATHGAAGTYLLGWNGDAGRALKANQFLLWHAMLHLKNQGSRWFDLGGIDEQGTPGISAFKLGVNGQPYELAGEYLAW